MEITYRAHQSLTEKIHNSLSHLAAEFSEPSRQPQFAVLYKSRAIGLGLVERLWEMMIIHLLLERTSKILYFYCCQCKISPDKNHLLLLRPKIQVSVRRVIFLLFLLNQLGPINSIHQWKRLVFGKKWQVAYLDEENDIMMLKYQWHIIKPLTLRG